MDILLDKNIYENIDGIRMSPEAYWHHTLKKLMVDLTIYYNEYPYGLQTLFYQVEYGEKINIKQKDNNVN